MLFEEEFTERASKDIENVAIALNIAKICGYRIPIPRLLETF